MKKIVIIGAGDFGKEVAWLIEDINKKKPTYEIMGFLDDDEKKHGQLFNGYLCLGSIKELSGLNNNGSVYAVIAMQNVDIRKRIVEMLPDYNGWETLIHPSANVANTSVIGKGCIVCTGSCVSVNTIIGSHCVFNISTTIGHDCVIGNYVSVMSGVCVSGHVLVKDSAYLATNCTIVPKMKVGEHAVVGAGSVVLRNVRDNTTVMGVPAKVLKF